MAAPIRVLVVEPGSAVARLVTVEQELSVFNGLVGGPIEGLTLTPAVSAYINEDGKRLHLPVNIPADQMIRDMLRSTGRRLMSGDVIVGPVVFLGPPGPGGFDTDVTAEARARALTVGLRIEEEA